MHGPLTAAFAAGMMLLGASGAGAQADPRAGSPSIDASVGTGGGNRDESEAWGRLLTGSLRVFLTSRFGIEAEVTQVSRSWAYESGAGEETEWSAALGVVMRTRPRRLSAFGSGGVLWLRERSTGSFVEPPGTPVPFDTIYRSLGLHFGGGADVRIAGPLLAYGRVQCFLASNYWLRVIGGVRIVVR